MSLPAYAEYKDSGVEWLGDVPKHWPKMALKWKARIRSGDGISPYQIDAEPSDDRRVPVFGGNGIMGYTRLDNINKPSIVIGRVGALCGNIHKVDVGVWVSDNALCLDFHDGFYNVDYLSILLEVRNLNDIADKSAQPLITGSKVLNQIIPCPPLPEQTTIARFLDHETAKIDALIAEQQRLIELLKEKRQAVISHAVTKGLDPNAPMKDSGVEWLGDVPEHWVVVQLKFNTLDMQTGPFGSQLHAEDYIEGGIPLINPAHMVNGNIVPDASVSVDEQTWTRLSRHQLKEGDLIFARRGDLGRCAIIKKNESGWLCGTGSLKAKLNQKLNPEYAYLLITSDGVISELSLESKGSTMENLNTETLGRVRLPIPPTTEQAEIIGYVDEVSGKYGELISNAYQGIDLLKERRSALISAAVTGKIDVRGWQVPQQNLVEEVQ